MTEAGWLEAPMPRLRLKIFRKDYRPGTLTMARVMPAGRLRVSPAG